MPSSFERALINRERNRQLLAKALDEQHQSEANSRRLKKIVVYGVAAFLIFHMGQKAVQARESFKFPRFSLQNSKELIARMLQEQMKPGKQMLVGENKPPPRKKSNGERSSFREDQLPPRIAADLKQRKPASTPSGGEKYSQPNGKQAKIWMELTKGKEKKAPIQCKMYRPMVNADLRKLPPPLAKAPPIERGRYKELAQLPADIAADLIAFPNR